MTIFSPAIKPTRYDRDTGVGIGEMTATEYQWDGIDLESAKQHNRVNIIDEDMVMLYDENGEVYIGVDHCHVSESYYRANSMPFLREYCASAVSELHDAGVVTGLRKADERRVRSDATK